MVRSLMTLTALGTVIGVVAPALAPAEAQDGEWKLDTEVVLVASAVESERRQY